MYLIEELEVGEEWNPEGLLELSEWVWRGLWVEQSRR